MTVAAEPALDFVIPARNEEANVERAVTAIRRSLAFAGMPEGRIIVVDDGSCDGTSDVAARLGTTVIRNSVPQGPRLAWHTGISATSAPWVVLTDADCHLDEQAIARFIPYLDHEGVGLLAGRPVSPQPVRSIVGRSARFSSRLLHETKLRLHNHDFQPIGRLMALRRRAWQVRDPLLGPCDRAVAFEVRASGYSIRYIPEAVVYYDLVASYRELSKDFRRTILSRTVHPEEFQPLPTSVLIRSALSSSLQAPLDAICWGTMRLAILAERRRGAGDDFGNLLYRWDPYGRQERMDQHLFRCFDPSADVPRAGLADSAEASSD